MHEKFDAKQFADFYRFLRGLNNSCLKLIYSELQSCSDSFACTFASFFLHRFGSKPDEVKQRLSLVFNFNCRNIDFLNLASVLGDKRILNLLPSQLRDKLPFKIFYKLLPPISSKVCNYAKVLKSLDLEAVKNFLSEDCCCHEFPDFVNDTYGHVFTGDLDFVKDSGLRDYLKFGAKFRKERFLPWSKVLSNLCNDLEHNVNKLAKRFKIPFGDFRPWMDKVNDIIFKECIELSKERVYVICRLILFAL